jgi:hypothetical protein
MAVCAGPLGSSEALGSLRRLREVYPRFGGVCTRRIGIYKGPHRATRFAIVQTQVTSVQAVPASVLRAAPTAPGTGHSTPVLSQVRCMGTPIHLTSKANLVGIAMAANAGPVRAPGA